MYIPADELIINKGNSGNPSAYYLYRPASILLQ